jgi:hypothetical protein
MYGHALALLDMVRCLCGAPGIIICDDGAHRCAHHALIIERQTQEVPA